MIDLRKLECGEQFDMQKLLLDFQDEILELKAKVKELEVKMATCCNDSKPDRVGE